MCKECWHQNRLHVAQNMQHANKTAPLYITASSLNGKFPQPTQTAAFFMFVLTCLEHSWAGNVLITSHQDMSDCVM